MLLLVHKQLQNKNIFNNRRYWKMSFYIKTERFFHNFVHVIWNKISFMESNIAHVLYVECHLWFFTKGPISTFTRIMKTGNCTISISKRRKQNFVPLGFFRREMKRDVVQLKNTLMKWYRLHRAIRNASMVA